MLSDTEFSELMHRIRRGDQEAARELVETYEPEIRRAARLRMTDVRMRRLVDSVDICQSVFGRFFSGADSGQPPDIQTPQQLMAFLTKMTRNRVIDEHRRNTAQKRAKSAMTPAEQSVELIDQSPGPKTLTELKDELDKIRAKLTPEELQLLDQRNGGASWEEVAETSGQTPECVRKQLERALGRVRNQLARES